MSWSAPRPLTDGELHRIATKLAERVNLAVFLELQGDVEFLQLLQRLVDGERFRRRTAHARATSCAVRPCAEAAR